MIPAGRLDRPCIPDSSKLSTEGDITEFKGESCSSSILKSGLESLETKVDRIERSSVSEMIDWCLSPRVVSRETLTAPFLRVSMEGIDDVLPKPRTKNESVRVNIPVNGLRTHGMTRGEQTSCSQYD